jgi:PTH1 family peptidyl-tRNA hydrolase
MILVVGLGNPGMKYKNTYHNIGFMTLDALAKRLGVKFSKTECDAKTAAGIYRGEKFVLAKPQTYMNLSGESVKKLVRAYGVDEKSELTVCYDDADLPLGKTRLREEGSAGTHNGMRSIVKELNTTSFKRIRIGIKTDELAQKEVDIVDLVLSKVDFANKSVLTDSIENVCGALVSIISGEDIQRVEERLNRKA